MILYLPAPSSPAKLVESYKSTLNPWKYWLVGVAERCSAKNDIKMSPFTVEVSRMTKVKRSFAESKVETVQEVKLRLAVSPRTVHGLLVSVYKSLGRAV